jgi:hypothetical protein
MGVFQHEHGVLSPVGGAGSKLIAVIEPVTCESVIKLEKAQKCARMPENSGNFSPFGISPWAHDTLEVTGSSPVSPTVVRG